MKNVLFVCTGNTCRSPMAEAFFAAEISVCKNLSRLYTTSSAGYGANPGEPPAKNAVLAMRDLYEIDISDHSASLATESLISNSSLVLTMTTEQKRLLLLYYPEHSQKIFVLRSYVFGMPETHCADVPDPYGKSYSDYVKCATEIQKAVSSLAKLL